jgi:excisionase family DNA binding protein
MPAIDVRDLAPLAYSIDDAVKLTGLSRATIYNMFADGRLPSLKIGKRRLVERAALDQLFAASRILRGQVRL